MKKNAKFIAVILFFVSFHAFGDGALAIDKNHGEKSGWAVNFSTTFEAQSRALDKCGFGCYIVVTFSGGCAAYAADQAYGSMIYGYASGFPTRTDAESGALNECRKRGGEICRIRVWGCEAY